MYNNTHAYTRPTKACNVWWRTEEGGGGGVGDGDGDGVGVIVGVGVGTVVASSSEAAVARRRWCGWWPWRSLSGGDGCADGGGGGVSGGGVGGGSVGVGTGVDGLAARVLGVPGRHPVAPPCHGARREESNPGPRQQGAAGADHHRENGRYRASGVKGAALSRAAPSRSLQAHAVAERAPCREPSRGVERPWAPSAARASKSCCAPSDLRTRGSAPGDA